MKRYLSISCIVIVLLSLPLHATVIPGSVIDSGGGQFVFTGLVANTSPTIPNNSPGAINVLVGTIDLQAGESINVTRLGIGGDSTAASGDNRFRMVGAGLDFTWIAGQQSTAADFRLAPAPSGGFSFTNPGDVNFTSLEGQTISIFWDYHFDFDGGNSVNATDPLGNSFNDTSFAAAIRPWLQFEFNNASVPEANSFLLMLLGGLAISVYSKSKK